jgi:toxin ParE1/3/4
MARYEITRRALRDIEEIWDYTISKWSVKQAEGYTDGLFSCFDSIADGDMAGKPIDHVRSGYRKASYGKHLIFFRVAAGGIVEIIRILHDSMDIESRLLD